MYETYQWLKITFSGFSLEFPVTLSSRDETTLLEFFLTSLSPISQTYSSSPQA